MATPVTPSRPPRAPSNGTDPPDRGGGAMLTDLLPMHPLARGFSATPMRPSTVRSRAEAFGPTPGQPSKQSRPSDGEGAAAIGPGSDNTAPITPALAASAPYEGRPTRSAALHAAQRLTKEAQAVALGLSGAQRPAISLGQSLGIGARSSSSAFVPPAAPLHADKEDAAMTDNSAENDADAVVLLADKDQDIAVIQSIRQRQMRRNADMTELCRAVDKACASGGVSSSGAELLHAALALAMRHGELGPGAPPIAPALLQDVRRYQADKPHHYQRSSAQAASPSTNVSSGKTAATGPNALPVQQKQPARRWENLSGMQTLGGGAGSAQAMAAKGGMKARAVVVTLPSGSPVLTMSAVQRKEAVNRALEEGRAPMHVRMLSSELNGMNLKLKPALNCSLEELFQQRTLIQSALDARDVQDSKQWVRYKVLYVPERAAGMELTPAVIRAGIEESIGGALVRDPYRLRHGEGDSGQCWDHVQFAVLEEDHIKRPQTVCIAGEEYQVAVFTDRRRKQPCSRCLGYHKTFAAGCHSAPRCEHCGSAAHGTMEHSCKTCAGHEAKSCPPICPNCNGPHRFDDRICKMAPRMNRHTRCWLVPSPAQAKVVRNQGLVDHQRALKTLQEKRKQPEKQAAAAAAAALASAAVSAASTTISGAAAGATAAAGGSTSGATGEEPSIRTALARNA